MTREQELLASIRSVLANWKHLVSALESSPTLTEMAIAYNCGLLMDEIDGVLHKEVSCGNDGHLGRDPG
ncbi:hypothetical protein EBZ39_15395 [bacterium]|nr:hypothetical protein [bacterium]